MAKKSMLEDVATQAQNRRSFVRKLALGATAGTAVLGAGGAAQAAPVCFGDVDLLQFLLNLEFLEAEFYTMATTGKTIDQFGIDITGAGTPGPTTGGQIVHDFHRGSAAGDLFDIANQLAQDERNHVRILQQVLYGYYTVIPAAKPAINLNALGLGLRNSTEFVQVGRMLEDIGISAYNWALYYANFPPAYELGALIMSVEGQHAGNLRAQCGALSVPPLVVDCDDDPTPPFGVYFTSSTHGGYPQYRSPGNVLFAAYGGKANASGGGFFPNGVNGYFKTSGAGSCD